LKIKIQLKAVVHNITNQAQLFDAIQNIWQNIDLEYIQSLYQSIPARLKEVRKSKGQITKY
jgi:hypothetical protein